MAWNVANLKKYLTMYVDSGVAVAIVAKHGIGKSTVVEDMAKEIGVPCIPIFAGQFADVGDVIGLPNKCFTKLLKIPEYYDTLDDKTKELFDVTWPEFEAYPVETKVEFFNKIDPNFKMKLGTDKKLTDDQIIALNAKIISCWEDYSYTEFAPPKWWPRNSTKPVWLFIDEANRNAASSVYSCLFDLILNQRLQGRSLPKGSRVIAAFNPVTDTGYYQVSEFDPALHDRFMIHDFAPDFKEWEDWAIKQGYDMRIVQYLTLNPDNLDPYVNEADIPETQKKLPSRRSWGRVNMLFHNGIEKENEKFILEAIAGAIGSKTATHFWSFIKKINSLVNAKDIFNWTNNIENTLNKMSPSDQAAVALNLFEQMKSIKLDKPTADNIFKFLTTIKKENAALFYNQMQSKLIRNNTGSKLIADMMTLCPAFVNEYGKICSVKLNF